MRTLAALPQRPSGVLATLEFVFAVHPSTIPVQNPSDPSKHGTSITLEALGLATRLLSMPPSTVDPERWFSAVAPQLLTLLDGSRSVELVKVAAYVIGFGILGRRQYGAPGTYYPHPQPYIFQISLTNILGA